MKSGTETKLVHVPIKTHQQRGMALDPNLGTWDTKPPSSPPSPNGPDTYIFVRVFCTSTYYIYLLYRYSRKPAMIGWTVSVRRYLALAIVLLWQWGGTWNQFIYIPLVIPSGRRPSLGYQSRDCQYLAKNTRCQLARMKYLVGALPINYITVFPVTWPSLLYIVHTRYLARFMHSIIAGFACISLGLPLDKARTYWAVM